MRECRICPCTDFGSAPACTIQVAHDVRSDRQFTLSPKVRAAGAMYRFKDIYAQFVPEGQKQAQKQLRAYVERAVPAVPIVFQ